MRLVTVLLWWYSSHITQCRGSAVSVMTVFPSHSLATVSIHPDTDVARLLSSCGCRLRGKGWNRDTQGSIRQAVGWILLGMEESVHTEDRNRYKG